MSIPSSGPLSMSQIRSALGVNNTNFRLRFAEIGSYGALNANSAIVGSILNGQAPHAMSKWRGYNNACQQVVLTTINQGQSVTLTASGASSYSWSTGQTTAQITVSPSTTTTFTVTGITSGCKNTSASRTITVIPATTTTTTTTTSTTTTTTAPPSGCQCLELYGGEGGGTEFNVLDCDGNMQQIFLSPGEYLFICALDYNFNNVRDGAYAQFNPDPSSSLGWQGMGCEECGMR